MLVSVGGPDLFFSYQKNGEKYPCYLCGGIFSKLWFLSPRCLFMATAGEMILGQADCQTQHDFCYIVHLKLLMLRPNDNCQVKLLSLKFRLKSSNRLIRLFRFKKGGNAKQVCNGKWTGCDFDLPQVAVELCLEMSCFHPLCLFCQLCSSSVCK